MMTSPFLASHHRRRGGLLSTASGVSALSGLRAVHSQARLPITLREGLAQTSTEMNPIKGLFGESFARQMLSVSARTNLVFVDPVRHGGRGIDLLSVRLDGRGRVSEVFVGEVKFGTSRLSDTTIGKQLGVEWTRRRLLDNASDYAQRAVVAGDASEAARLRKLSRAFEAAAKGDLPLHREQIKIKITGKNFRLRVHDSMGRVQTLVAGPFEKLGPKAQRAIRSGFESSFRENGCSCSEARLLADEACKDPNFFRRMARDVHYSWRAGLDWECATTALTAGAIAAVSRLIVDLVLHHNLDLGKVLRSGALGALAGAAGHYAETQAAALLAATATGRSVSKTLALGVGNVGISSLGKMAGGLVSIALFSYGAVIIGMSDWRTAHRSMFANSLGIGAGVLAPSATLSIAMAVGTASTGTAIGTLSGAAAMKAALAWLGLGSIATGGFGVAGGLLVLTGIGAIFMLGVPLAFGPLWSWLDDREKVRMIEGRFFIEERRLRRG